MDMSIMNDYVASHGCGDMTDAGKAEAKALADKYRDEDIPYAEIAYEIVFRGMVSYEVTA